jgi:predicted MFS family arabinose efflux permease
MHWNIKVLLVCSTLLHSALLMLEPYLAMYMETMGSRLYLSGLAIGIFHLCKGAGYFIVERYSSPFASRKLMVTSGYLLFTVGHVLYLFASKPVHVMGIQIVFAIATVIIMPSWDAIRAIYITEGHERSIFAHFSGYRSFFEGVAVIIGALVVYTYGFYALFVFMTVLSMLATICSTGIVDERLQ